MFQHFLSQASIEDGRDRVPRVDVEAGRLLLSYSFPGNVRELHNVAQHTMALTTEGTITPSCLPDSITQRPTEEPRSGRHDHEGHRACGRRHDGYGC